MSRHRLLSVVLGSAFVLSLAGAAVAADQATLRRACKVGDKYVAEVISEQKISQERSDGAKAEGTQKISMEAQLEVLSVAPDGLQEIKVTYKRMTLSAENPGGKIDYDSADPAKKDIQHPLLIESKARLGKSLTMKVTALGEVKEVTGMDAIAEEMLLTVPVGPQRDSARAQLKQAMTPEAVNQQMSVFALKLPEEPKGVGDSWSVDQTNNSPVASMAVKTTYKVDKLDAAAVEVTGVASAQVVKAAEGLTVALDPESKAVGHTVINRANAALFTSELNQVMKMSIASATQSLKGKTESTSRIVIKAQ